MHKINGNSDDAHLYYKRKFAERWHNLLGEPPVSWNDRTAWMKEIADAPRTTQDAVAVTPKVQELLDTLENDFTEFIDSDSMLSPETLLNQVSQLETIALHSMVAREVGLQASLRSQSPYFNQLEQLTDRTSICWSLYYI